MLMNAEKHEDIPQNIFRLLRDYADTRVSLVKLQFIRNAALVTGSFMWMLLTIVLVSVLFIFLGIVIGFWFSQLTGSYVTGFLLASALVLLLIVILAVGRRIFFINPVTRLFIRKMFMEEKKDV
jgi:hypothetical protein